MDPDFPCSLLLHIPFPSHRLAQSAIRTLSVDEELSPLVKRSFTLVTSIPDSSTSIQHDPLKASLLTGAAPTEDIHNPTATTATTSQAQGIPNSALIGDDEDERAKTVLRVDYKATTNRMLRVAVNGFFESLGVVVQVMEELDVDVLHEKGLEGLEGVQGVEQGMTGTAKAGA